MKELLIQFTERTFRKLLSVYVFTSIPFDLQGRICDLVVSVPDHCLSFYFVGPSPPAQNISLVSSLQY